MKRIAILFALVLTATAVPALADPPAPTKSAAPAAAAKKPPPAPTAIKPVPPPPPAPPAPPPPPAELDRTVLAFVGSWNVKGSITLPGQAAPVPAKFRMACKKISGKRAALCTTKFKVKGIGTMDGTFVAAHDAMGGRTHFMGITSMGEVHDHQCTWKSDTELACDTFKTGPVSEDLTFSWANPKTVTWKSVEVTPDGTITFEATGKRAFAPKKN